MAVVQNLYQIFKLPASYLVDNNCDIKSYTITQGLKEGNIVSIGDNIIFQQIRYMRGDFRDHKELFGYIQKLRNNMNLYTKVDNFDKYYETAKEIAGYLDLEK